MSAKQLDKIGAKGPLREYLARLAYPDQVFYFDDFLGDTINLDNYAVANGGGASATSFAIAVASGGTIASDEGTANDATASSSLIMPKIFYGDQNCGCHIRLKSSAVTSIVLECGFIDAVPGSNTAGVNDVDTPTAYATDAALFHLHTGQTLTTPAFVTAGTSFTTTKTSVAATLASIPAAATYCDVRIQLVGDAAYCWVNGILVASHTGSKVEGGTALAPWIYHRALTATSRTVTVDYIAAWQDRAV
jgi:hypothetical protein